MTESVSANGADSTSGKHTKNEYVIIRGKSYFPRLTVSWGYNRAAFTRSTLHFKGPGYDFSLNNVTGHDRPSGLKSGDYTHITRISIPQYNYAVGFQITDRWGVTLGMDHIKYVMDDNQTSHLFGTIDSSASPQWAGNWNGETVTVDPDFVKFEHTDGFNYLVGGVRYSLLRESFHVKEDGKNSYPKVYVRPFIGLDLGLMIPRTDVRIFGYGLNNRFHIAGVATSANVGAKVNFFKCLFLQANVRGGFATLPSVLIHNDAPDRAHHSLGFLEATVAIGGNFWQVQPRSRRRGVEY